MNQMHPVYRRSVILKTITAVPIQYKANNIGPILLNLNAYNLFCFFLLEASTDGSLLEENISTFPTFEKMGIQNFSCHKKCIRNNICLINGDRAEIFLEVKNWLKIT